MMLETIDVGYYVMLVLWLAAPAAIFVVQSRCDRLAGVIVYSYLFGFFVMHWPGALVHASPWSQFTDSTNTVIGFELSTYALLSLLAGALFIGTPGRRALSAQSVVNPEQLAVEQRSARTMLLIGAASWLLSFTAAMQLPSASSIVSAGKQCALLAICLFCRMAWQQNKLWQFRLWLGTALLLPVFTVMTLGFIGYGIAMLGTALMFVAMFYRPRWLIFASLIAGIYVGISFWVAYSINRGELRIAISTGGGIEARTNILSQALSAAEPFNLADQRHLDLVDVRLNQNMLVGAAVKATPSLVPYVYGETIIAAIAAIIPRAIWPDKPAVGGSGQYVSKHTLIDFAVGTSIGMGQVLELYINFGVPAVVIGFLMLGMLLRTIDFRLIQALEAGDMRRVQLYFLVGTGALQSGGSLTEMVAAMGGGAIFSLIVSRHGQNRKGARRSDSRVPPLI